MSEKLDNLLNLVKPYGLSDEEGRVYLWLLQHGFTAALVLSRQLKMSRTKVYRLLDRLRANQLVEYKVDERGMKFGATHPQKFSQLVTQQEQHVASLKQTLPDLVKHLSNLTGAAGASNGDSKVLYYEGVEGLQQVSANITRAQGTLRVFEMEHMSDFLSRDFSESIREELVANKILCKDLTNKQSFPGYTDVTELIKSYAQTRYISPEKLKIRFETLIYNNVYATYSYKEGQIFCVEIYNEQLAAMQKQIFDFIWNQAQPLRFIDERGAAELA